MSYDKTWHRDYAAECIKRYEGNKLLAGRADLEFAKWAMTCGQGAKLAQAIATEAGDSKTADIAATVLDTISSGNRYRKITTAQQHALAVAVLEKLGTARAIGAAVWGLTDDEINNA